MCAIIRNERGVGLAAALLFVLILAALGYVALALTTEDMNGATAYVNSEQALFVAQSGLEFGTAKLIADGAWTGLASPGKPAGLGSFTVAVSTTDENGNPLTGGQKMVLATGHVGTAVRQVRKLVTPGGGNVASVYATAQGNAESIPSSEKFVNIGNMIDSGTGPNNTWGYGSFDEDNNGQGLFAGWSSSGLSGTITKVEIFLYGYMSEHASGDKTEFDLFYNNNDFGPTYRLQSSDLNNHVGASDKGYWYVDVTSARSWTLADFAADLELRVTNQDGGGSGHRLYVDAVGFRITVSGGGGGGTATSFKEITS